MTLRRLVGIDLGIASAHTVRVLDETGATLEKRKAVPTVESLSEVETAALAGAPEGTKLEVVIEPTGPAWLPIAVFFTNRGHVVFRVSSAKASDLRKFLSRHTKTNGIDADTLARLPLFDPAGLQPLALPGVERAVLDRRVRACDRLTQAASRHKVRIKDLVRQLLPMTPLGGDLGVADLAVLERWADPNALVKAGLKRVTAVIVKASHNHQGGDRAAEWITAAHASLELYGSNPAVAFADLAAEVATEVRLLRAVQGELAGHATERETAYRWVDPAGLAQSLPGLGEVGGPAVVAVMGDPARFTKGKQFRSFTGLVARTSETGDTNRTGQPMSKAGSSLLRTTFVRAADHARKQDPQLARIYYVQMVERGKDHLGALCIVAANLAERTWVVMRRGMPYVICDTHGQPVTPDEAKAIIAEHYTVPAEVRARRRSKKMGKAPQAARTGRHTRGDLPHQTSSTATLDQVNRRTA
jgi:transposase